MGSNPDRELEKWKKIGQKYRRNAITSLYDCKRHDRISRHEAKAMSKAQGEGPVPSKIATLFGRDQRAVTKAIRRVEAQQGKVTDKGRVEQGFLEAVEEATIQPARGAYVDIRLQASKVLIDYITVLSSDSDVPFRFMIFDREQAPGYPNDDDKVWEEPGSGYRLTYVKSCPLLYQNRDDKTFLHCGIAVEQRPIRFDIEGPELEDYLQRPVTFTITVRYRLPI
jgi:hypothetical protein